MATLASGGAMALPPHHPTAAAVAAGRPGESQFRELQEMLAGMGGGPGEGGGLTNDAVVHHGGAAGSSSSHALEQQLEIFDQAGSPVAGTDHDHHHDPPVAQAAVVAPAFFVQPMTSSSSLDLA